MAHMNLTAVATRMCQRCGATFDKDSNVVDKPVVNDCTHVGHLRPFVSDAQWNGVSTVVLKRAAPEETAIHMGEFFPSKPPTSTVKTTDIAERLLATIIGVYEDAKHIKPILNLIQTTGTGKTYEALRLMELVPSLYFLCPVRGKNFQASDVIMSMIHAFEDGERVFIDNKGDMKIYFEALGVLFLREMEKILFGLGRTTQQLRDAQFEDKKNVGIKNLTNTKELCGKFDDVKFTKQLSPESKKRLRFLLPNKGEDWTDLAKELFSKGGGATTNSSTPEVFQLARAFDGMSFNTMATSSHIPMTVPAPPQKETREGKGNKNNDQKTQSSAPTIPDDLRVVILDEVDGLVSKGRPISDELCWLRCVQRAFADKNVNKHNIILMSLTTSSRLEAIEPRVRSNRQGADSRGRPVPFIELVRHDIFQDHVFVLGRPLWQSKCGSGSYNAVVETAVSALISGHCNTVHPHTACSLLMLRFGFEPVAEECHNFVANHMATMCSIRREDTDEVIATCVYPSEPVLVEAAACLTAGMAESSVYTMQIVVEHVKKAITLNHPIRPSVGDRGEVVAACLLGLTLDLIKKRYIVLDAERAAGKATTANQKASRKSESEVRDSVVAEEVSERAKDPHPFQNGKDDVYDADDKNRNMSRAVPLSEFLVAVGTTSPPGAEDYLVNFTHAIRLETHVTEQHCYQAVFRRAAFYVREGAMSVDMIVIAWKEKADNPGQLVFCPVRIQVKNHKSSTSRSVAEEILLNMSPKSKCQPDLDSSELEVGILLVVGKGGAASVMTSAQAQILPHTGSKKHCTRQSHLARDCASPSTDKDICMIFPKELVNDKYFGYVVNAAAKDFFTVLRSEPGSIVEDLLEIAQFHVQETIDEHFYNGFQNHFQMCGDEEKRISLIEGL